MIPLSSVRSLQGASRKSSGSQAAETNPTPSDRCSCVASGGGALQQDAGSIEVPISNATHLRVGAEARPCELQRAATPATAPLRTQVVEPGDAPTTHPADVEHDRLDDIQALLLQIATSGAGELSTREVLEREVQQDARDAERCTVVRQMDQASRQRSLCDESNAATLQAELQQIRAQGAEMAGLHTQYFLEQAICSSCAFSRPGQGSQAKDDSTRRADLEHSAATQIQALARGHRARKHTLRAAIREAHELRETVSMYEKRVIPGLVVDGVLRMASVCRDLSEANSDCGALRSRLAEAEAESVELRQRLGAIAAGRHGGG